MSTIVGIIVTLQANLTATDYWAVGAALGYLAARVRA